MFLLYYLFQLLKDVRGTVNLCAREGYFQSNLRATPTSQSNLEQAKRIYNGGPKGCNNPQHHWLLGEFEGQLQIRDIMPSGAATDHCDHLHHRWLIDFSLACIAWGTKGTLI